VWASGPLLGCRSCCHPLGYNTSNTTPSLDCLTTTLDNPRPCSPRPAVTHLQHTYYIAFTPIMYLSVYVSLFPCPRSLPSRAGRSSAPGTPASSQHVYAHAPSLWFVGLIADSLSLLTSPSLALSSWKVVFRCRQTDIQPLHCIWHVGYFPAGFCHSCFPAVSGRCPLHAACCLLPCLLAVYFLHAIPTTTPMSGH
jgi:hypothetical protein